MPQLLLLALAASLPLAAAPAAAQHDAAPMLPGTLQVLNGGADDQIDPHIDGTLAVYVNDDGAFRSVRYFDFETGADFPIENTGLAHLPDVSGGLISFTHVLAATGSEIFLLDPANGSSFTVPGGSRRANAALGGNLVAFEDRSFSPSFHESEIVVYDYSSDTLVRLTSDALMDLDPAVSPTGSVVAFQKCQVTGSGCEIYTSIQSEPGIFTTRQVTAGPGSKRTPDTNGTWVVYASDQSGEMDLYFQPVTGGAETRLALPGEQRNPSISGHLVVFESSASLDGRTQFDLFLYDLVGDRLYRVTETPVNEVLNDIAFSNGLGRIVYAAPGEFGDFDVFAFTFELGDSAATLITDLIALVDSLHLDGGIETSLLAKLRAALAAVETSDVSGACAALTDFADQVRALSGKKLTPESATQLIGEAVRIQTALGCAPGLSPASGNGDDPQGTAQVSDDLVANGQNLPTGEPVFTHAVVGAGPSYIVTDLGNLGLDRNRAYGINADGQVVGAEGGGQAAFRWDPTVPNGTSGRMWNLGLSASAHGINAYGQVVGDFTSTSTHAFRTAPNRPIDPSTDDLGAAIDCSMSKALAINASGEVVGWAQGCSSATGCFSSPQGQAAILWTDTGAKCVSGRYPSYAYDINTSGQIVGQVNTGTWVGAVLWQPDGGSPVQIEHYSSAIALNDYGQVLLDWGSQPLARLWTPATANGSSGSLITLALPGDTTSHAYGINTQGQVVGTSGNRAFLWTPDAANGTTGTIVDLNTLIPAGSDWTLMDAQGINDAGQIVGSGRFRDVESAFLLTPDTTPPITTVAVSPLPNAAGWHTGDVTISLTATDGTGFGVQELVYSASGAQPIPPTTVPGASAQLGVTAEGVTTLTYFARDLVGNVEQPRTLTLRLDRTSPVLTASATAGGSPYPPGTWTHLDVIVSFTCTDALSGVAATTPPQTIGTEGENQSAGGTCTDVAGNSSATTLTGIDIDKTAPYTECGTADGLWHGDDVSIACKADELLSGLRDPADATFALTTKVPAGTETTNALTESREVCDLAGNCTTAGPVGFNQVDKKGPELSIAAPFEGAIYLLDEKVVAAFSCWDGGSSVASCTGTVADGELIDTSSPGTKGFTVTATDHVGNPAAQQVTYTVVDYVPVSSEKEVAP